MYRCLILIYLISQLLACVSVRQEVASSEMDAKPEFIVEKNAQSKKKTASYNRTTKAVKHSKLSAEWRKEFLHDNARKSGIQTSSSGLQYVWKKTGQGRQAGANDRVKVNYELKLASSGKSIDSSLKRGKASILNLNTVIVGWREGIALMREGDVMEFYIPPNLGYGKQGLPPKIKPNEVLILHVELLEVLK